MCKSPEQHEFVQLLEACQQGLMRFILPLVPCHADALDVLQETVAQLWEKFDQYDRQQPFEPWARGFAYTQVLKFRKLQQRRHAKLAWVDDRLLDDQLIEEWDLQQEVQQRRTAALRICVEKLSPDDLILLQQRYWAETSIRDAAVASNTPEHTLYRQLHRIRFQLRKCIEATIADQDA